MGRSFKPRIFIRLFLITALIIGANRFIAQQFLTEQLREQIHHDMGRALIACSDHVQDRTQFVSCFKSLDKGSLISNVADFYELCQAHPSATEPSSHVCVRRSQEIWTNTALLVDARVEFAREALDSSGIWLGARMAGEPDGTEVWIRQRDADRMVEQMWELRDRNLIRVLPLVIVALMFLTMYMMRVLMDPIVSMEANLTQLNASNLDKTRTLKAPYREFRHFGKVFEDLRIRLHDSFVKARRFASDASHELRTPLTILRGKTEQLINEFPLGSEAQVQIRSMGDEVERLIEITEKLLLLSRADANSLLQEVSDVNLSELILQLIRDAHSFQSSLKISSDIQPNVIWRADKTLVRQLIQNLYSNAVNYNQPNGWIHFTLKTANDNFVLTIENPSTDIPTDLLAHAFDRFYRGDASHARRVDGLGLGLSICDEIAKLHAGSLTLQVGAQSTVVVTLDAPLQRMV